MQVKYHRLLLQLWNISFSQLKVKTHAESTTTELFMDAESLFGGLAVGLWRLFAVTQVSDCAFLPDIQSLMQDLRIRHLR